MLSTKRAALAALLLLGAAGSAWAQCDLQANSQLIANYAASAQQLATSCMAAQTDCLTDGAFTGACCSTCLSALRTFLNTNTNLIKSCGATLGVTDAMLAEYNTLITEAERSCNGGTPSTGTSPAPATGAPSTPAIAPVPLMPCSVGGDPHVRTPTLFYTCNDVGTLVLSDNAYFTVTAEAKPMAARAGLGASVITNITVTPKAILGSTAPVYAYSNTTGSGTVWVDARAKSYVVATTYYSESLTFMWVTILGPAEGKGLCYSSANCTTNSLIPGFNANTTAAAAAAVTASTPGGRRLSQATTTPVYSDTVKAACLSAGLTGAALDACVYDYQVTGVPATVTVAAAANDLFMVAVKDSSPSLAGSAARAGYLGALMALGAALLAALL